MHEVLQTFRAAADRLDEDPDLTFTASSASYYRWVMETSPELFARIRLLVAAGRWIVTGGQWVEPDCNLPAGESVCRQLLYGQRFLAEHLGVTAGIGYNVDSFGHAGSLPQLLAASGIGAYVFMRPGPEEKDLPSPAFRWRGTDGTELPAYRIPIDYSTPSWAEEKALRTGRPSCSHGAGSSGSPSWGSSGWATTAGGRPDWPWRPCTRCGRARGRRRLRGPRHVLRDPRGRAGPAGRPAGGGGRAAVARRGLLLGPRRPQAGQRGGRRTRWSPPRPSPRCAVC